MRLTKVFAFAVCLLISFFSFQSVSAQQNNTEKEVLSLHEKKFDWMCHKQLDSLGMVLDDKLVYIHSNGWTESKTDLLSDLNTGKLIMNKVTVNEAKADYVNDNTVIVHAKGVFNVMIEKKPVDVNLYYTEVYIKKKKSWLLVSRHASKL